jgi:hypothetical protein
MCDPCEGFCLPARDARLRAAEVCRGWRTVLETERSLWTTLDLSCSSGRKRSVTAALFRAAAARAGGALQSLDVSGYNGCGPLYDALLDVVTANAGSLLELRAAGTFLYAYDRTCEKTITLLRAAPRLRLLVADVLCDAGDAARMLSNEGVLQPLRIRELYVSAREADDAALHAFAAALAAHASPLPRLFLKNAQLGAVDVLDALIDAALANRVACVQFNGCVLSAPSLARLLSGDALTFLDIGAFPLLLDAHAAALWGAALRTNTVLQQLELVGVGLWDDVVAALTLLSALVAHPSLRDLSLDINKVAPEHAACAGTALFALVASNVPALQRLYVSHCGLGDAGLRTLMDALPRNTHLRTLWIDDNGMSEAFARDVLLPAVRANTSLTKLSAGSHAAAREAEVMVLLRAVEAGKR